LSYEELDGAARSDSIFVGVDKALGAIMNEWTSPASGRTYNIRANNSMNGTFR
jgi:hypothetical protein